MSKPRLNKREQLLAAQIERIAKQIASLYWAAAKEAAAIAASVDFNPNKPFSFDDYPKTKARADKLIKRLANESEVSIVNGINAAWTLSNDKNSELARNVFGKNASKLTPQQSRRYFSNNDKAREAFTARKENGMNLSDRVWKYSGQFKEELEMGLDLGLRGGLSASEISRDLRKYLQQPEMLFRRVRDEHGNLHLSQRAKAYHPGQGVYRSSYKNAMRLTRTENNMAYRTSDYESWQQMDFVVGIEVKLSNNHTINGVPFTCICDTFAGKYPKTFKFTGWHPQCRCHAIPILKTEDEMDADTESIFNDEPVSDRSVNSVDSVPTGFSSWVKDNSDRMAMAQKRGALPYFLRDNKGVMSGQKSNVVAPPTPTPKATEAKSKIEPTKTQIQPQDVYETIAVKEDLIRKNKNFETAVAYDSKGNIILEKKGGATSVGFTDAETKLFKDTIFTHNHPRGWAAKEGSMGRIGNSFSPADIKFAIKADMAEIRAVTPNYTFIMKRPPNGWPNLKTASKMIDKIDDEIHLEYVTRIRKGKTTVAKASATHYHNLWKRFVSQYEGAEYSKRKTL